MKQLIIYCLHLTIWLNASSLLAQVDTTITIPEISVSASPTIRDFSQIGQQQSWDSQQIEAVPAQNLADLLSQETGVYIKSYGLGSLATSSIRGAAAGHSLVLWNGLPIQSPTLGLLDLALLPSNSVEQISLEKGGNSALWGSAAIGGLIRLDNRPDYTSPLSISSQSLIGDFGQWQQSLQVGLGNQKFQSRTKLSYQEADNDFFYPLAPGLPERQQTNAGLLQRNLLQDFYWKAGKQQQIALHYWYQFADREIPPTNVQSRSLARQTDEAHRAIIDWRKVSKQKVLQAKAGLFLEDQIYTDELIGLKSRNWFNSLMLELNHQWSLRQDHQILLGATYIYNEAEADGYGRVNFENRAALFGTWKYVGPQFNWQLSLRQEMVDQELIPLTPHLSLGWLATPRLNVYAKLSRNYRLPTLNDRFWRPGGNPDLLAESGWSQELGLKTSLLDGSQQLNISLSLFNRNIDNWILWALVEGQPFFSANNIAKVWSRGFEPRISYNKQWSKSKLELQLAYDYIRSTNQIALENPQIAEGAQLVYTPIHQGHIRLGYHWRSFGLRYQQRWVGSSQGINEAIDAFSTAHIRLHWKPSFNQLNGLFFIDLNNLWDQDYFIIERRPMPPRYLQIGLNLNFNHKNQK